MSKEALKLALKALEVATTPFAKDRQEVLRAQAALREALAEPTSADYAMGYAEGFNDACKPAQQEPVAWMFQHEETGRMMCVDAQQVEWGLEKFNPRLKKIAPLYTSPPAQRPWVGLTDEEAQWLYDNCRTPSNLIDMTEAKLKELNT